MSGPYALMWSGGKDCTLALQRATAKGLLITILVNIHDPQTGRVRFHATDVDLIAAQARSLGVSLMPVASPWSDMDSRLRATFASLKKDGYAGVIFGDIHLADVRAWYEDRVRAAGLEHVEPLWGEDPGALVDEFIGSGGRAVLTCVDTTKLGPEWLGRVPDPSFVAQIRAAGCDPSGENGEFHTFAFDGPRFSTPVEWVAGELATDGRFAQLQLSASSSS